MATNNLEDGKSSTEFLVQQFANALETGLGLQHTIEIIQNNNFGNPSFLTARELRIFKFKNYTNLNVGACYPPRYKPSPTGKKRGNIEDLTHRIGPIFDIDLKHLYPLQGLTETQRIEKFDPVIQKLQSLDPNYVLFTGNGLQFGWFKIHSLPTADEKKWYSIRYMACIDRLWEYFPEFSSDSRILDPAGKNPSQLFRLGGINIKKTNEPLELETHILYPRSL